MGEIARIRARLEEHAIPLEGVRPDTRSADLAPFVERVASRSIIGVGESAHGTREFPQVKHRLVREILRELDFEVVTWETPFPETVTIAGYVVGRTDDQSAASDAVRNLPWLGREWLELVEWLRNYNSELPDRRRVPLYGFTKTYDGIPASAVREFFERADPTALDVLDERLAILERGLFDEETWTTRGDRLQLARETVPEIRDRLTAGRAQQIEATSEADWELARQHTRILQQVCELQAAQDDPERSYQAVRDRIMAENVDWIRDYVDADRAIVSAANGHVKDSHSAYSPSGCPRLGSHLRDRHGDDYYALALDFGRGTVRAHRPADDGEGLEIDDIEFPPPNEMDVFDGELDRFGSFSEADLARPQLHAVLDRCDFETAILDFDALRTDEMLREWLERPHLLHGVGSRHWPSKPERSVVASVLPAQFDGLLYTDEIHSVTTLDR